MESEAPLQTIERLERELAHLHAQCQVAHQMSMAWKARYEACKAERARLEKRLVPKQAKAAHRRIEERMDGVQGRFGDLLDDAIPDDEDPGIEGR